MAHYRLGHACLLLGRFDEAQSHGNRVIELLAVQPARAAHGFHLLGDIATHPDRFDAESGEAHSRKALALAEPRGMRPLVAHCGKRQEAQEQFAIATTMYREMDMRFWLENAEAERKVFE